MTRTRAETAAPQLTVRNQSGPIPTTPTMASNAVTQGPSSETPSMKDLPSIRFIMHQDPRAARPSLSFSTITRTLPDESAVIKVGRYSERDVMPEVPKDVPSAAAVGFKSKVVSRKHCELWCKNGEWWIKDVKSSSGTFLNHIRLSQPNQESKPFKLKDGDIIQLGIDFRGGEEMIFRCVKIRIECNRGWQQALNAFNKQTHQRLRNLGKAKKEGDNASMHTSECSICLMSIAPCQSLFVAPCSHVWHYKCIRPILNGATWPNFLCPNCRAVTDLEADVDDPVDFEEWEEESPQENGDSRVDGESSQEDRHVTPKASTNGLNSVSSDEAWASGGHTSFSDLEAAISNVTIADNLDNIANLPVAGPSTPQRSPAPFASSSVTQPVAINVTAANEIAGLTPLYSRSSNGSDGLSPNGAAEGPMTPRNDAGPFVLDGSGSTGRAAGQRFRDATAAADPVTPENQIRA
ncbi:FHA domain-containing protein [Bimuria novae-zelandiae CBS 107.79]|uniref:RING-type E3 ubiquitin transferase n=1 Tax=Bimuria novae-zelandiae CBS 107.79 TaxID=1447943 RepID=A0A6A5UVY8_9PLEO|nr:FHA domain-containing protein [Bimuria novae-zelandiae CBS 107.79]